MITAPSLTKLVHREALSSEQSFIKSHHTGDCNCDGTILLTPALSSPATLGRPPQLGAIIHRSEIDGVPPMSWQYMKYLEQRQTHHQPH